MKILRLLAAAFVVSTAFSGTALAQARLQLVDPPSSAQAAADAAKAARLERGLLRTREVNPNWDAVQQLRRALRANPGVAQEIELPIFADTDLVLAIDRMEDSKGTTSFFGRIAGEPLSSAVIVDAHGTFALNVNRGSTAYQVTLRGNAHEAAEIDRAAFTDFPDEPRHPRVAKPAGAKSADLTAAADDGSTIDVMVVYSPEARSTAGGTAAIQNQIELAIASTNQAYVASNMVQRVRLVHTAEVAYAEPASYDIGTTLDDITNGSAPFQGVAGMRNTYGADIVSMWVERGGSYCGIGWLMQDIGSWFAPNAYNVEARTCATAGGTMSHEMGHNMGLEHDLYVSPEGPDHPVAQRYAHGYVDVAHRFRTIMAYPNQCTDSGVSCARINQYSNPNLSYGGGATGNATTANAALMLDQTRVTVANFRASTVVSTPPTLSFALPGYTATEGGATVSAVVTRSGSTTAAASVTWTTANGTAIAGSDFGTAGSSAQKTGTLTWAAGDATSRTIALPILDDTAIEPSETFTLTLSNPVGATLGGIPSTTATIVDNDSVFNVQAPTLAVNENGPNVTLRVTRTGSLAAAATVTYRTADGSALAGTDFGTAGSTVQPAGVLSFAANQASRDINIGPLAASAPYIPVVNDSVVEPAKTFTIALSAPGGAGAQLGTTTSATVTINSEDVPLTPGPNTLQFPAPTATVAEGTANLILSVQRTGSAAGAASVDWAAGSGSALAGTDFGVGGNATPPSGTLAWAAGDAAAKSVVIPIINDSVVEGAKTFTVALSNPVGTGVAIGAVASVAVTLTDNDSGVVLGAPAYSVAENGRSLAMTVNRMGSAALAASARWTTADGTATAGQDYGTAGSIAKPTGKLAWVAGDATPRTFTIPIINDTLAEGNETFTVLLDTPSAGLAIGTPSSATVTIVDDDAPPGSELRFAQPKYAVLENGGSVVLTVNRVDVGGGFGASASVAYATQAGTALATSDFTAKAGTLAWAAGDGSPKTLSVPIVNDAIAESPESFKVLLSAPSPGTGVGTPEATVLILDDDEGFPPDGAIPQGWVMPAGANASWHVSNDPGPFEGAFSLKSDSIEDNERADVQVAGTFAAGTISFRAKVSSEASFDTLRFYLDGVAVGTWSGTTNTAWQAFSLPLPAGAHTLRWSYEKDGSASIGQDAAWIDAVSLPATP